MGLKRKIFGAPFDKKIVRQRTTKGDLWDKAAEIEDPETGEKMWKLKSDGKKIPKPDPSKVGYLFYRKWWHKILFMPKQRIEYAIFEDGGEEQGTFKDPHSQDLVGGQDHHIFQTHRNLQGKKYVDLYSEDDKKELYILGALGLITLTNLAGMYIIASNADKIGQQAIAQAVKSGIGAAKQSSQATGGNIPGVQIIPVIGFLTRKKLSQLKN